jgi:hypothetical protein
MWPNAATATGANDFADPLPLVGRFPNADVDAQRAVRKKLGQRRPFVIHERLVQPSRIDVDCDLGVVIQDEQRTERRVGDGNQLRRVTVHHHLAQTPARPQRMKTPHPAAEF